jgi:hypothetical protein
VNFTTSSVSTTTGNVAPGVAMQSIGGGGGVVGFMSEAGLMLNSGSAVTFRLGSSTGGAGAAASSATVNNNAVVNTTDWIDQRISERAD